MANGIDGRRIHHLRTKVAKFGSLHITQFVDRVGTADDTRVGRHEAIHIGPYLQAVGLQCGSNNCSRVVRPTPSEIGHFACIFVGRDESGHQSNFRSQFPKCITYQFIGQFRIQDMLALLLFGLDEVARIEPLGPINKGCDDARRNALAIADNSSQCLGRQVADKVESLIDAAQFGQQLVGNE